MKSTMYSRRSSPLRLCQPRVVRTQLRHVRAAATAAPSLAAYPFPDPIPLQSPTLFTAAVQDLMQHLGTKTRSAARPFVHATSAALHHTHRVLPRSHARASAWPQALAALADADPRLVLCVQPLSAAAAAAAASAEPQDLVHACSSGAVYDWGVSIPTSTEGGADNTGGASDSSVPHAASPLLLAAGAGTRDSAAGQTAVTPALVGAEEIGYFGVVAQSAGRRRSTDGSYLVKTVQQLEGPGCHCMHYSLQRVEAALPLLDQAVQYWL